MKQEYGKEFYVTADLNRIVKSFVARLRTGTLLLMIEVGRFRNIPVENRVCPVCNNGIEDEIHFLFVCSFYTNIRTVYFNTIQQKGYTNFENENVSEKLKIIMKKDLIKATGNFINSAYDMRQNSVYI